MRISEGPFVGLRRNGYGLILSDPAWPWISYGGKASAPHTGADAPYKVMSMEDLHALPVVDLAAADSVLIMWVIGSHLDQAIELGRSWGFTYKSDAFVWVK